MTDATSTLSHPLNSFVLWVDGAEGTLVLRNEEVTIGGARPDNPQADICFQSNLARKHLSITRANGSYQLQPYQPLTFKNQVEPINLNEQIRLESNAELSMGDGVLIRFRLPTVLSLTAVLDFPGSHQPQVGKPPATIAQVILMDQNCLIGPGNGQHIRLKDCEEGVILYQNRNQLWCKSKAPFSKNDEPPTKSSSLESGDTITGRDFRFRLEAVEKSLGVAS